MNNGSVQRNHTYIKYKDKSMHITTVLNPDRYQGSGVSTPPLNRLGNVSENLFPGSTQAL